MDKVSYYNINVDHNKNVLLYNTLTDLMVWLTIEEYSTVKELLKDLQIFNKEYPIIYKELKNAGFIVNEDYNELSTCYKLVFIIHANQYLKNQINECYFNFAHCMN